MLRVSEAIEDKGLDVAISSGEAYRYFPITEKS
jgi:hypothetical protein